MKTKPGIGPLSVSPAPEQEAEEGRLVALLHAVEELAAPVAEQHVHADQRQVQRHHRREQEQGRARAPRCASRGRRGARRRAGKGRDGASVGELLVRAGGAGRVSGRAGRASNASDPRLDAAAVHAEVGPAEQAAGIQEQPGAAARPFGQLGGDQVGEADARRALDPLRLPALRPFGEAEGAREAVPEAPQHRPGDGDRHRQGRRGEVRRRVRAGRRGEAGVGRARQDERAELHRLGRRQPFACRGRTARRGARSSAVDGARRRRSAARRRITPRIASGGTGLPLRRISMRPSRARRAAARRTGPMSGRQGPSSAAGEGAGDLARADRTGRGRGAAVWRRISSRIAASAGTAGWFMGREGSAEAPTAQARAAATATKSVSTFAPAMRYGDDSGTESAAAVSANTTGRNRTACGPWDWTAEAVCWACRRCRSRAPPLDEHRRDAGRDARARAWNGGAVGTPALVPYSFATRDSSYYTSFGAALPRRLRARHGRRRSTARSAARCSKR